MDDPFLTLLTNWVWTEGMHTPRGLRWVSACAWAAGTTCSSQSDSIAGKIKMVHSDMGALGTSLDRIQHHLKEHTVDGKYRRPTKVLITGLFDGRSGQSSPAQLRLCENSSCHLLTECLHDFQRRLPATNAGGGKLVYTASVAPHIWHQIPQPFCSECLEYDFVFGIAQTTDATSNVYLVASSQNNAAGLDAKGNSV